MQTVPLPAVRCRDSKNTNFQLIQWEAYPLQLRVALRLK